ncbi:hypothetical protein SANT12839_099090 [Streptomyces antimycoticus]|uniref:PAS fold-4 domain-containing protein n=1 Tax=Streptomyces antimycoticus TaxID=68175 RepID=A0A4D4KRG1_9ACTN|nr:hypothetical protein SANT12839_099090 [Streptomyces antimycoticus]
MSARADHTPCPTDSPPSTPATAVLDSKGTILSWSRAATELLDRTSREVCGHPVWELLANVPGSPGALTEERIPAAGEAHLRHRSGSTVDVLFQVLPLEKEKLFALAVPSHLTTDQQWNASPLRQLFPQDQIAICVHDTNLEVIAINGAVEMFDGAPVPSGSHLRDVICSEDAEAAEAALQGVLDTGTPLIGQQQHMRFRPPPARRRTLSLSAFQLQDAPGRVSFCKASARSPETSCSQSERRPSWAVCGPSKSGPQRPSTTNDHPASTGQRCAHVDGARSVQADVTSCATSARSGRSTGPRSPRSSCGRTCRCCRRRSGRASAETMPWGRRSRTVGPVASAEGSWGRL